MLAHISCFLNQKGDIVAATVVNLMCPGCGEPVDTTQEYCKYCGRKVLVSSFSAVSTMSPLEVNKSIRSYQKAVDTSDAPEINKALGLCNLKLKLFDKAALAFDKASEDNYEDSEVYFYHAVAIMGNKKPFLHLRPQINQMMELLQAAIMIEPRGIYYYVLSYIKQDYFARKFFSITPDWQAELATAKACGLANMDVSMFYEITGLTCPDELTGA